jgi:hypothetical protein
MVAAAMCPDTTRYVEHRTLVQPLLQQGPILNRAWGAGGAQLLAAAVLLVLGWATRR